MTRVIGGDSLAYLSLDGLYRAMGASGRDLNAQSYCDACFSGDYPITLVDRDGGRDKDQLSFLTELS